RRSSSRPRIALAVSDLPAPDSPTIAVMAPGRTENDTSSTSLTSPLECVRRLTVSPLTSMDGVTAVAVITSLVAVGLPLAGYQRRSGAGPGSTAVQRESPPEPVREQVDGCDRDEQGHRRHDEQLRRLHHVVLGRGDEVSPAR